MSPVLLPVRLFLLPASEVKFAFGAFHEASDVGVMPRNEEDRADHEDDQREPVIGSEDRVGDRGDERKADAGKRHVFQGEQEDQEDGCRDQSGPPVDHVDRSDFYQKAFPALESVPDRENVADHAEEAGVGRTELPVAVKMFKKPCKNNAWEHRLQDVQHEHIPGPAAAVNALKIGKAGIFAALQADVVVIDQLRKNDRGVQA